MDVAGGHDRMFAWRGYGVRLISCSLTEQQIRDRTKTETRRLGWQHLKAGNLLCFVDKAMGHRNGSRPRRICIVRVSEVWREPLYCINFGGCRREGFPQMQPLDFVEMFRSHMKCQMTDEVTVIRFEYIPGGSF